MKKSEMLKTIWRLKDEASEIDPLAQKSLESHAAILVISAFNRETRLNDRLCDIIFKLEMLEKSLTEDCSVTQQMVFVTTDGDTWHNQQEAILHQFELEEEVTE
jgi:hypothetical protein